MVSYHSEEVTYCRGRINHFLQLLTGKAKAVEAEVLERHMRELGFEYRQGRHESTPEYNGLDDGTPAQGESITQG